MRLIDADKIFDDNVLMIREEAYDAVHAIIEKINNAPTVDAEPVRHGHWIENDNGTYTCSECQAWIPNEQHYYARYCLHCGAKMDEVSE